MKAGKEEEKANAPMFPRLHVNDTDKGGPRAPPRNKMALYEQLSIPSQRFNSPRPPHQHSARSGGGPSSSQGNGPEGSGFAAFYARPSFPASDGDQMRTSKSELQRRSNRHVNFKSGNAVRSVAESSSLHQRNPPTMHNSCQRRADDEDDFRVPTFVNSENYSYTKDITGTQKRKLSSLHAENPQHGCTGSRKAPDQLIGSCSKHMEQTDASDAKSEQHERNCNKSQLKDSAHMVDQAEESPGHLEAREKLVEQSRLVNSSSNRHHSDGHNMGQELHVNGSRGGSIAQNQSQSKVSHSRRLVDVTDLCNRKKSANENKSLEIEDADRNKESSDTSMVDSASVLEISPDDVVGMIGPKQFWKARRAIVNQQRVFAIQVFELHRLIKVQKLLAASPHLLLEENSCFTPQKVPIKTLAIEHFTKAQPRSVKSKDEFQKPNQNADHDTESTGVAPLPANNDAPNRALTQSPRISGAPVPPPSENRSSNPWGFQPPAQQWLVPVMSPSEGLIYKPYSGPCPPTAGFMPPVYGNYSPMSLPAGYGGVLSGAPPMTPNYLPAAYGHPGMSPMSGMRPTLSTEQNSRSSCNMSFPKSDQFTARPWMVHASKDSEVQGSTASSPCEPAQGEGRDSLPLFPMAPAADISNQPSETSAKEQHKARVIRVVPHNARSASESAARIFRSIQEERRQQDQ